MAERPMSPEEMQNFEEGVLHHRDEARDASVPASEEETDDVHGPARDTTPAPLVQNPD